MSRHGCFSETKTRVWAWKMCCFFIPTQNPQRTRKHQQNQQPTNKHQQALFQNQQQQKSNNNQSKQPTNHNNNNNNNNTKQTKQRKHSPAFTTEISKHVWVQWPFLHCHKKHQHSSWDLEKTHPQMLHGTGKSTYICPAVQSTKQTTTLWQCLVFGLPGCGWNCLFTYMLFLNLFVNVWVHIPVPWRHMGTIILRPHVFHTSQMEMSYISAVESLEQICVFQTLTIAYLEPFHDPCCGWSLGLVLGSWPSKEDIGRKHLGIQDGLWTYNTIPFLMHSSMPTFKHLPLINWSKN